MGRFKGRKIRGVILFCFVFCAVCGFPASAVKNNLFILLPLSSAVRFVEKPSNPIGHPLSGELSIGNEFFYSQFEGLPIPIFSITTTSVCPGQTSTIIIESIESSLPDGQYTVTYDLGNANVSSDNVAPMIAADGKGTFASINLPNVGNTTLIIKSIQSDEDGSFLIVPENSAPINISDAPVVTLENSVPDICSGKTTIPLGGSVEGATQITWSSSNNGTFSDVHDPNATWTAPSNFEGTATLTLTASNGCDVVPKSITVDVKEMPIVQIMSATERICEDESSTLEGSYGGSATGIIWTSSEDGIFSPSSTAINATWTPEKGISGTVTLTLTTTGSPWNISDSKTIVVNALSVGGEATPHDPNPTVCYEGSTIISLTGYTGTIQWQQSSDNTNWTNVTGGIGSTSPSYITPDLTETTYYRAEVTSGICTSDYSNVVTVEVNPKSVAGGISVDQTICSGDTPSNILLTGTTGTIQWQSSPDNSAFTDIPSATNATLTSVQIGALSATTYYRAVVKSGVCDAENSNVVTVTVNPLPTATLSGTKDICIGSSANLSIALTGTAPWSVTYTDGTTPVTVNNIASSPYVISVAPTATKTYTLTAVSDAHCPGTSYTGSATVTVNPLPVPTITGSATACSGSTGNTYSTEAGMINYGWSVSAGGTITGGQGTKDITVSWSTAGSQSVTVNYTDVNGCTASQSTIKDVIVNSKPTLKITNPAAVCAPATVNLTATAITAGSTAGLTYSYWTDAAATASLANPATAGAGTYWIKGITPEGCFDIKPVTVTVNPKPVLAITSPNDVCSPATVDLSASSITAGSSPGLVYSYWTDASATSSLSNYTSVAVSGTYYIKATNTNGCSDIKPVTVKVNSLPFVTTSNSAVICSGSPLNIGLNANINGTTFTWTLGTITGIVNGATEGSGNTISQVLTSSGNGGTVQYIVTPTSPDGCVGSPYTITVTVHTPVVITLQPEAVKDVCEGGFAEFIAVATGLPAPTVQWKVSTNGTSWTDLVDGTYVEGATTSRLTIRNPQNNYQYKAVFTNTGSCSSTATSTTSLVKVTGDIKIKTDFSINGCGNGLYNLGIEIQGDQLAIAWTEMLNGTDWIEIPGSRQNLNNGTPTYTYQILYGTYPPDTQFRIHLKSVKCSASLDSNSLPFGISSQVSTSNTCLNTPVTFNLLNGQSGGTWTIKDPVGNIFLTVPNGASSLTFTPTTTAGCWTATYQNLGCSDTKSFVVFPSVMTNPTAQQSSCGNPLVMTAAPISSFFTTEYSILAPGSSSWSAYRDLAATNAAFTSIPGCWTIKSRYKTNTTCGTILAGTVSPCAESTVSAVVFPIAPSLGEPFNTCASAFNLPTVPSISGFTTEWSIDGSLTFTSNPTIPTTPGCHTIQARYALSAACGTSMAGTASVGCVSNMVSVVIFPPAPTAPTLTSVANACGAFTVNAPPFMAGFDVEYSFSDGAAWQSSNASPITECVDYKVKTRYVLSSNCGSTLAKAASSADGCKESPATIRRIDTSAPVFSGALCNKSLPAVCVNTGNTYVHSDISWDVSATDNCNVITSNTATLSGATSRIGLTTLKNVIFNVGTTLVTWTASDGCNTSTCSFTVTVNPLPVCSITGNNGPLCPLSVGNNYTAPAGMSNYFWSISGNGSIQGATNQQVVSITTGANKNASFILTLTIIDPNGCTSQCQKILDVLDLQAPTFTVPTLNTGYCVENIYQAIFKDVPNNSLYDLTYLRPDYFLFAKGFTMLDLPAYSDNCALAANPISWTIDFGNNGTIELSGTGQLSTYLPAASAFGIEFPVGTNRITYTVTDAVGNFSIQYVDLVVLPRPIIEKNF